MAEGDWRLQVAAMLLLRQAYAYLVVSQWFATNTTTRVPWDELLERDYGHPQTDCVETQAGVFERQWSAGTVRIDCGSLFIKLPGDGVK